ncbi:MAG: putative toxin [Pseudonocardiaceae bacterium]
MRELDPPISVQPDTYHVASSLMGDGAATDLLQASLDLAGGLSGTGGMGGTDQAGQDWATSYDDAASTTNAAIGDLVNALQVIAGMLKQTGFNHRAADAASNPANPASPDIVDTTDYSAIPDYAPGPPPSAHGGSGDPPWGWKLVEYAVGYLWPNGDPGKLRSAETAWTAAANDLTNASGLVPQAVSQIQTQQSPEVQDAVTVCQAMAQHINDVATSCRDIATACTNYAQQIDQIHQEIEDEITSFLKWSVGIELGSAALSEIGGEFWGQGVEGARIAKTGANIAGIIEKLIEFVKTAVQAVRNVVSKIGEVAQNLTKILGARLSSALTTEAEGLPKEAETAEELAMKRLANARLTGVTGENLAGIDQAAKVRIPSASGTAAYRIPDALTDTTLTEVKNVTQLSYTSQLQDFSSYAISTGRSFDLVVRADTVLSKPLQKMVDTGVIHLYRTLPPG